MRILWIVSVNVKERMRGIGESCSGGWIVAMLRALADAKKNPEIGVSEIAVVCAGEEFKEDKEGGIVYYQFPQKYTLASDNKFRTWLRNVNATFQPDVVHIHGSEFRTGLTWIEEAGSENALLSVQGIISRIALHYLDGIRNAWKYTTIRDVLRRDSMQSRRKEFLRRGEWEKELISRLAYVAGRTEWDYCQVKAINPAIKYYFVGESLRAGFYQYKWDYSQCEPGRIFVSQGDYPIKGIHKLLEAVAMLKDFCPVLKVRIAGYDILNKGKLRRDGYGKYIQSLIHKFGLEGRVEYIGPRDEQEMIEEYLKANVFVLPSAIENSPNSLAEAQEIGTPVIASISGGSPEMVGWNPKVLYRFDEPEVLAHRLKNVLESGDKAGKIYTGGQTYKKIYNPQKNLQYLTDAYRDIEVCKSKKRY